MSNAAINAKIRQIIHDNGAKLVSVDAVAKDGTIKTFLFSDAARRTHLQSIVTASGAKGAETRAINNPDLFNVWDMTAKRWRSFNLANVLTVRANGQTFDFRLYRGNVAA